MNGPVQNFCRQVFVGEHIGGRDAGQTKKGQGTKK